MIYIKIIKNIIKITVIFIILIGIYSYFIEPNMFITKKINLGFNDNKTNLKVVLFSDTHFGNMYKEKNIMNIVEKINNQNPDIVIFGGDLIDSYYKYPPDTDYIISQMKEIKSKYGKYSVFGNHDYGGGAEKIYKEIMKKSDFIILKNQIDIIDSISIRLIGLDDYLLGNPDKTIVNNLDKNYFNILISHAPDLVNFLDLENINFALSGHTHGGQVFIPFLTEKFLPPGGKNFLKGMFDFNNEIKSKLFVTSGIGVTQINFRFMNIPEIVSFDLAY